MDGENLKMKKPDWLTLKKLTPSLIAFFIFSACASFFYLGNSALNCTNTLATGPGDQTSGLIWLTSVVNAPLWGPTDVSNAPYGENLRTPVFVTGALQYVVYWFVSLFVGPVCGYNLYTALGFVFSAMVLFLFVKSITKRNDVAIFAGFAATFTPYLQIKTGVHPSYVFFGVFIIAIWLMISLWQKPNYKKATALGFVIASFFFIDPYYSLLGAVSIFSTAFALFVYMIYKLFLLSKKPKLHKKFSVQIKSFVKPLLVAGCIALIFGIGPLLAVKMKYGSQIDSEVGATRSDIKQEAFTYAARPAEYLLPNPLNPYIGGVSPQLPDFLTRKAHGSNPAENTLSISMVVTILATITILIALLNVAKKPSKKFPLQLTKDQLLVVLIFSTVALFALLASFPPKSHGITFPSEIITSYINIWRVFARLSVVVTFGLVIIAAIGLAIMTSRMKKGIATAIVLGLTLIVAFEYLTFVPLQDNRAWSYNQVHPFYYWLREQKDIKTIAEYPLNEPGKTSVSTAYFTGQYIHKKKVINSAHAGNHQAVLRNALRDITDPQTAPALASLGIDVVAVHAEDKKQLRLPLEGFQLIDWNKSQKDPDSVYVDGKLWVLKVTAAPDADNLILVPGLGFSELRINSTYTEAEHGFTKEADLSIIDLKKGTIVYPKETLKAKMTIISAEKNQPLTIKQKNKVVWQGEATKTKQDIDIEINGEDPITLIKSDRNKTNTIIISNLNLLQ